MAFVNPGPRSNELLWNQSRHRSAMLFEGNAVDADVNIRRGDQSFWSTINNFSLDGRIKYMLRTAGFLGVFECGYRKVDRGLITALVERWRPETNTFHLRFGEVTVTLEDVACLMGLPINGHPVLGDQLDVTNNDERAVLVYNLLGITTNKFTGNKMLVRDVTDRISSPLPDHPTDVEIIQRARCVILLLLSCSLFNDSSNGTVKLGFLPYLEDLNECRTFSWGSAVLAWLYRNLCKAAVMDGEAMCGCVSLLQLWAYTRIRVLAPIIAPEEQEEGADRLPFGAKWRVAHRFKQTTRHSVRAIRSQLANLHEDSFVWRPYEEEMGSLADYCLDGQDSWCCECYILWNQVVEYHSPSRVLRQYGFCQWKPLNPPLSHEELLSLRKLKRSGHT